jgi:hypothetical protein
MIHALKCPTYNNSLNTDQCVCDGYHTFDELYDHRIALYIALCKTIVEKGAAQDAQRIWRSLLHSDGSKFDGWFVLGMGTAAGEQITYHLPIACWDDTNFVQTLDRAPEWDGHTSDDVLKRLKTL